jgi:hypothetical protein
MKMMAPIPGMSLTREPGNSPWEQPPLYNTAEEALAFYLDKLSDEDRLDDLLFALEAGFPVSTMVDTMTSYSVMEGYHTFDIKMLLSPVLHEYLITLAEAAGIKYTEDVGPSREERMNEKEKQRTKALLLKGLAEGAGQAPSEESMDEAEDLLEGEEADKDDMVEEATPLIKRRM